jgi:hypothetical protein
MNSFNPEALISRLQSMPLVLSAITSKLAHSDAAWKPAPEHWSILEICCHLLDEERDDFPARLKLTLANPDATWPPLNLDQAAEKRQYLTWNLSNTVSSFTLERESNVSWLRSLLSPLARTDWERAHHHNVHGRFSARDLLTAWTAHDALHLRQIAKRFHQLAARDGGDAARIEYAGDW